MMQWCAKCGDGPVRGFYLAARDKMRFRCPCGYVWYAEPLTKRKNLVLEDLIKFIR